MLSTTCMPQSMATAPLKQCEITHSLMHTRMTLLGGNGVSCTCAEAAGLCNPIEGQELVGLDLYDCLGRFFPAKMPAHRLQQHVGVHV